jgi:RNA polymerase subunit RPABC4/transcription elongation factor Spt4
MKQLICRDCGAPFMGQFIEGQPPICHVCNSEDLVEVEIGEEGERE